MVARKKPKKAATGDAIRERPESVRAKKLPNIYLRDKLYIPTRFVDEDVVIRQYTHCEFDDNVCRTCDLRSARPCNDCYECQWGGLKGTFLMAGHKVVSGRPYYTVPLGDIDNVEYKLGIDFDDFNLVDKTTRKKFAYPIKYTGQLYDYQEAPVRNILRYKMGILKSKPRTGKTQMATAAICKYGQRAIIMADQKDFLDGFLETFHGFTNVLQLEEECGHKLVGFPKTLKDFDTLQVILITYQQLIKNTKAAKDKLRKLRTLYGVLCVDEVHRTCAPQFSRILGLMTTRMRFGLSATPHRKDKRENLAFHMIGPVIAKTKAEALKPKIAVHYTPDTVKSRNQFSGQAGWTRFCQFLAKHEDRNMMIVDQAIKDLKKGRNIVIPIMFTEHAEKLKREINAAYGEEIAEVFLGGSKHAKFRKQIVDDARAGKIRVVIGIRRLVQIGINVPQWDTLYYVKPLNNAPNWEQESYRILTPLPDKQVPLIRMFVDRNMNRSLGCFKSTLQTSLEFGHELLPKSKERLRDDYGSAIYDVSAKAKKSVKTGRDSSGVLGRTF